MEFIEFLKKEFGLNKHEALLVEKLVKAEVDKRPKAKKVKPLDKKNRFISISALLDEALANLPNEDAVKMAGDHDEISAEKWNRLHADAKDAVLQYLKAHKKNFNPDIFKKFISSEKKQSGLSDEWKLGLGGSIAIALFVSVTLVNYAPIKTAEYARVIDDAFFGFLQNNQPAGKMVIENKVSQPLKRDDLAVTVAKMLYVIKNQDKIKNQEVVPVAEEDLFGRVAGEMEASPDADIAQGNIGTIPLPTPPPAPTRPPVKEKSLVARKCIDFFTALKEGQDKLSQKIQDSLENLIK